MIFHLIFFIWGFSEAVEVTSHQVNRTVRDPKLISMFQIVKFPNDPCVGTNSRNGTCFTSSECTSKGGTSAGSCASGYGVCCTVIIGCGQTSSQNCTYIETSGANPGNCRMSVCRCSTNICQLRLDFLSFIIAGPSTRSNTVTKILSGESAAIGATASDATQCLTDQFTVSTSSSSVPVLCGTLTNDHIFVQAESDNDCNVLNFNLGISSVSGTTIPTRSWQIKVTQYSCDYSNLAPNGCLQYFFGSSGTGTVRTFNYGGNPAYHLANQKQSICVRREKGNCRICWIPVSAMSDFQVSGKIVSKGLIKGSICCGYGTNGMSTKGFDCVMIPGASNAVSMMKAQSICGRVFGTGSTAAIHVTICSRQTPFQISFLSDNWEYTGTDGEAAQLTSGFNLRYTQQSC